jgi:hypothetical protein
MVLDGLSDHVDKEDIIYFLENVKYLYPRVMNIQEKDIGEWSDDHPLNKRDTQKDHFEQLFSN